MLYLINFRDRCRTTINVLGDSIGCAVVEHLSRKELKMLDNQETPIATLNINQAADIPSVVVSDVGHEEESILNRQHVEPRNNISSTD